VAESAEKITATENALRELVATILEPAFGSNWIEQAGVSENRVAAWRSRREEEGKKRTGAGEQRLIYYSDLFDLREIILEHWQKFTEFLGKRRTFETDMDRLEVARNAIAHGRDLRAHEESFVDAISTEIRNKVTIARTMTGVGGREHFPRFESVVDSFGNQAVGEHSKFKQTGMILHPDDRVEFRCRGWDPDGEPFQMKWRPIPPGDREEAFGADFVWEVGQENISEDTRIQITLASGRSYHRRHGGYDDMAEFAYTVLPR
jgi:hypothetical protein